MMSKKRFSQKGDSKKSNKKKSDPSFDRRSMDKMMADIGRLLEQQEFDSIDEANAYLQQVMASGEPIPSTAPQTPVEQAQEMMYEAFEASGKRRIKLAKQALTISDDCVDAYVLLAEESAKTLPEARDLYATGVKVGERVLGKELFTEAVGHFWGMVETRPYMRARAGLANCLWLLGEHSEAIEHHQEMLRLNPGDNQGIRYQLLTEYMEEGMNKDAEHLLSEYDDDASATWLYNHALLLFKKGDSKKARIQLLEAIQYNPLVPGYLLKRKRLPKQLPPYVGFGDKNEAVYYVTEAGYLWSQQAGALDWLQRVSAEM
jgi:tetratricopeptide (TPR) repeat protein